MKIFGTMCSEQGLRTEGQTRQKKYPCASRAKKRAKHTLFWNEKLQIRIPDKNTVFLHFICWYTLHAKSNTIPAGQSFQSCASILFPSFQKYLLIYD
jgi:hypothetical protein